MGSFIEIKDLGKNYGYKSVFSDLSHKFESGKINLILGRNGSGKSTLLNVMSLAEEPDHGKLYFNGSDYRQKANDFRSHLGYLSAELFLIEKMTVREYLDFYIDLRSDRCLKQARENFFDEFGLGKFSETRIFQLSSGNRKKVALCAIFCIDSEVFMFDEPFSSLDKESIQKLGDRLSGLVRQGKLVLMTSHQELPTDNLPVDSLHLSDLMEG